MAKLVFNENSELVPIENDNDIEITTVAVGMTYRVQHTVKKRMERGGYVSVAANVERDDNGYVVRRLRPRRRCDYRRLHKGSAIDSAVTLLASVEA